MISIMVDSSLSVLPKPLDRLSQTAIRCHTVGKDETLFHQGEKTRGLFYVHSGCIELRRVTESGHQSIVCRTGRGETFAEASLFHKHYHCDAIALETSEVIECKRQAVLNKYRSDTEFALSVTERFANQVQHTRMLVEIVSIKSAEERVYRAMVEGLLNNNVRAFASMIGLSPEATYRSLSLLSRKGKVIKAGYGQYELG